MSNPKFYGWKLLATFWAMVFINLGFPNFGSPIINAAMLTDLHLDRQTLGWVFSTYLVMSGLPGPLVALSINRYGVRTTLLIGSALVITGALFMALVTRTGRPVGRLRRRDRCSVHLAGGPGALVRAASRAGDVAPLYGQRSRRIHRSTADEPRDHGSRR
jgi:MFS family permease